MEKREFCCISSLILLVKRSRRLERGMVAVSACLFVSFLVVLWGLGRAESTLLSLRVSCVHCWIRREYWWHHSLGHKLLLIHHHLLWIGVAIVAKSLACCERHRPNVPDDVRNRVIGIQLCNAIHFGPVNIEGYQPLPILTSPGCFQLANFTCVPHCDRINEERPIEGIKPSKMASPL